jgi:hypothetical protein
VLPACVRFGRPVETVGRAASAGQVCRLLSVRGFTQSCRARFAYHAGYFLAVTGGRDYPRAIAFADSAD